MDFLGCAIDRNGRIRFSDSIIARFRKRATLAIYQSLLHYPMKRKFEIPEGRIQAKADWDLVSCVLSLQRRIYGEVKPSEIRAALGGHRNPRIPFFSSLGRYPMVDSPDQLRDLDGWLVSTLRRALKRRYRIFAKQGGPPVTLPSRKSLISGAWYIAEGLPITVELPSYYLMWRYVRASAAFHGIEKMPSAYGSG